MKVYTYKGYIFTIEQSKVNAAYICKCEHALTILKQTYIGYNLNEVKKLFTNLINQTNFYTL